VYSPASRPATVRALRARHISPELVDELIDSDFLLGKVLNRLSRATALRLESAITSERVRRQWEQVERISAAE
jgi:hypothetical protein